MASIEITTPDRGKMYFRYLEEVAEWLERVHGREVRVTDVECQIASAECDFVIFGESIIGNNTNYEGNRNNGK